MAYQFTEPDNNSSVAFIRVLAERRIHRIEHTNNMYLIFPLVTAERILRILSAFNAIATFLAQEFATGSAVS